MWYMWCVDNIIINTVLLGFVLAYQIVIRNSDTTTSNTSDRSNTKTSNTSHVS